MFDMIQMAGGVPSLGVPEPAKQAAFDSLASPYVGRRFTSEKSASDIAFEKHYPPR